MTGGAPQLRDRTEIRLGLAFWAACALTALLCGAAGAFAPYAFPFAGLIAAWPWMRGRPWAPALLDWLGFPFVVLTYAMLHAVVPACWQGTIDARLAAADVALLGDHAAVLLEPLVSTPLTVVMSIGYASYYLLPTSLGAWLYRRDRRAFRELMVGEVGALFIGYLGYLYLPAVGPHAHLPPGTFGVPLTGDFAGTAIQALNERAGHFARDAFPSLHTANAVTLLLVLWRHHRRLLAVYAPFALTLIAATVYLRFHYVVDVLAGAALALVWQAAVVRLVARESAREAGALQSAG